MVNKIAIFASGRGSNARALYEASQSPYSPFEIGAILSDNPESDVLKFAEDKGIKTYCKDGEKAEIENHFLKALDEIEPDTICLAGYMRVLSPEFVNNKWAGKIVNIHPSLLPKYKGLNTHARAINAGDTEHGATVHYVTEKLDDGEIIEQCSIKIRNNDTPNSLAKRLLKKEHELYWHSVKEFITPKLSHYHGFYTELMWLNETAKTLIPDAPKNKQYALSHITEEIQETASQLRKAKKIYANMAWTQISNSLAFQYQSIFEILNTIPQTWELQIQESLYAASQRWESKMQESLYAPFQRWESQIQESLYAASQRWESKIQESLYAASQRWESKIQESLNALPQTEKFLINLQNKKTLSSSKSINKKTVN